MNRKHRKQLATIIRDFLVGKISAFEFDDLLQPYIVSDDATVKHVAVNAWFFYDDCHDHYVHFNKPAWGYFQRLLLVLDSNHQIVETTQKHWHGSQLLAAATLATVAISAWLIGLSPYLLLLAIPAVLVCWLNYSWRSRLQLEASSPYREILMPFSSFAQLNATYKSVPRFVKLRHSRHIEKPIRGKTAEGFMWLLSMPFWPFYAALCLVTQVFPSSSRETNVVAR